MKKCILCLLCLLCICIPVKGAKQYYYDDAWHDGNVREVQVLLDSIPVTFDVPPLIAEDHTLIPVRGLFEACGASVLWDGVNRSVQIQMEDTLIRLKIDGKAAIVNKKEYEMPISAKIVTDEQGIARTMIPLRFIAEAFSYFVKWDASTYTVSIFTKPAAENAEVKLVSETELSIPDALQIEEVKKTDTYFQFRVKGVSLRSASFQSPYIKACDWDDENSILTVYIHTPMTAEIKKTNICFTRLPIHASLTSVLSDTAGNASITIDAGHGGTDPGALGKAENGMIDLQEKDVALDVALMVKDLLDDKVSNIVMTRESDVFVELTERAEIANRAKTDLFISVHCNAFTADSASGSMVICYKTGNDPDTFTGETLATCIQRQLIKELGTEDRGVQSGPRLVVIKRTDMPAVIVETAFITNQHDKEILASYEGRRKIAVAIANGIINSLNLLYEKA